ncbi:MAG: hypothetical protein ACYS7Y_26305 [Planctomycetota bacterium]|jgi:hypothetical protein
MPRRFSGEVRLTISKRYDDNYDVKIKAPGCSSHDGASALQDGYTKLHGEEKAIDEVALVHLRFVQEYYPHLLVKAAKVGDTFHVSRDKANRFPGGPTNLKTKRGR